MGKKQEHIEQGERIVQLISAFKIENVRQLALNIGMDVSQLNKVAKGDLGLPQNWAIKIAETYNINLDWLLRGVGQMIWINKPNSTQVKKGTDIESMANDILNLIAKVEVLLDEVAFLKAAPPKYPKEYWTSDLERKAKESFDRLASSK